MIDLIIQIVNYNTKRYLPNCLNGVFNDLESSGISYEILILDNNSQDDLKDLEGEYKQKNITFYYSNKNSGFGAGQNLLSKKAESKYILILNPDIKFLEKNTIKRLLDKLKENSKNKVIGLKLLTNENKSQEWDHGEISGWHGWLASKVGASFYKERNEIIETAWVSGAFFLMEREIFKKIDGFDENFFLYKEEEDLCLRIRDLGFKIIYDPTVSVMHCGTENKKNIFFKKSQEYFINKHFKNKFYYPILRFISRMILNFYFCIWK